MLACLSLAHFCPKVQSQESDLVGHWKLQGDFLDHSGNGNAARNHGANFAAGDNGAARFDGVKRYLEIPHNQSLALGRGDFSLSLWVFAACNR